MQIQRTKRKTGIISDVTELVPTADYRRERRVIERLNAGSPDGEAEVAALGTISIDPSGEAALEQNLARIEARAVAVLKTAGLKPQVREYFEAKAAPHGRTAFLARVRPKQPRRTAEGEVVDALRALSLLLRMHRALDLWAPFTEPGYRHLNDQPVTKARWQMRETVDGIADAALDLGWIAHRLRVWPLDRKQRDDAQKAARKPRTKVNDRKALLLRYVKRVEVEHGKDGLAGEVRRRLCRMLDIDAARASGQAVAGDLDAPDYLEANGWRIPSERDIRRMIAADRAGRAV